MFGIVMGALWGFINLYFIKQLIYSLMIRVPKNPRKTLMIAFIKFPLLYVIGYQLLLLNQHLLWNMLIGFSLALPISLFFYYLGRSKLINEI